MDELTQALQDLERLYFILEKYPEASSSKRSVHVAYAELKDVIERKKKKGGS